MQENHVGSPALHGLLSQEQPQSTEPGAAPSHRGGRPLPLDKEMTVST